MGRVYSDVKVNGRSLWTLFDTGARNNYIVQAAIGELPVHHLREPRPVALGGAHRNIQDACDLDGTIDGYPVDFRAYVLDGLGSDEGGRPIEALFGAIEMQRWGIRPVPDEERLDMTHYPEEFI